MQVDGVSRSQNPCTGLQVKIAVKVCRMVSGGRAKEDKAGAWCVMKERMWEQVRVVCWEGLHTHAMSHAIVQVAVAISDTLSVET